MRNLECDQINDKQGTFIVKAKDGYENASWGKRTKP